MRLHFRPLFENSALAGLRALPEEQPLDQFHVEFRKCTLVRARWLRRVAESRLYRSFFALWTPAVMISVCVLKLPPLAAPGPLALVCAGCFVNLLCALTRVDRTSVFALARHYDYLYLLATMWLYIAFSTWSQAPLQSELWLFMYVFVVAPMAMVTIHLDAVPTYPLAIKVVMLLLCVSWFLYLLAVDLAGRYEYADLSVCLWVCFTTRRLALLCVSQLLMYLLKHLAFTARDFLRARRARRRLEPQDGGASGEGLWRKMAMLRIGLCAHYDALADEVVWTLAERSCPLYQIREFKLIEELLLVPHRPAPLPPLAAAVSPVAATPPALDSPQGAAAEPRPARASLSRSQLEQLRRALSARGHSFPVHTWVRSHSASVKARQYQSLSVRVDEGASEGGDPQEAGAAPSEEQPPLPPPRAGPGLGHIHEDAEDADGAAHLGVPAPVQVSWRAPFTPLLDFAAPAAVRTSLALMARLPRAPAWLAQHAWLAPVLLLALCMNLRWLVRSPQDVSPGAGACLLAVCVLCVAAVWVRVLRRVDRRTLGVVARQFETWVVLYQVALHLAAVTLQGEWGANSFNCVLAAADASYLGLSALILLFDSAPGYARRDKAALLALCVLYFACAVGATALRSPTAYGASEEQQRQQERQLWYTNGTARACWWVCVDAGLLAWFSIAQLAISHLKYLSRLLRGDGRRCISLHVPFGSRSSAQTS